MNPIPNSPAPDPATQDVSLVSLGRFRALADANFDAVMFLEDGIITDANPQFGELFRCRVTDVIGKLSLETIIAPQSLNTLLDHLQSDDETIHEAMLQRLDGSRFIGEIRTRVIHFEGRPARVATVRDISARKQSEGRNRLFLELVQDLSQALTQSDIVAMIVNKAMHGLGGHRGIVGLLQCDGTIGMVEGSDVTDSRLEPYRHILSDMPSPLSDAAHSGNAVWLETQDEYIRRYPALAELVQQITKTHATAALPLRLNDRAIGAIAIGFAEPRRFEQDDRDFLLALAHQAALALDRSRLYEAERAARAQAEAAAARMARLQSVMSALSQALTPAQVADVIIKQGIAALEARAGSVALLRDGNVLEVAYSVGYSEAVVTPWLQMPLAAEVPLAACVRDAAPVWVCTKSELAERFPQASAAAIHENQAWAALPLIVDAHPIGALGLSFTSERTFDAEERILMETLAAHCAQALERSRLFQAEAEARAAAEEANELKVRFLGMISHELRTPLTSIKGFASTLLATDVQFDPATQRQYMGIIDTEANKLTSLVEQLLDVSRLQAGNLPINPSPQSLVAILDVAAVQMQTLTFQHLLDIQVSARLPMVMADVQRIAQVIVNLVDNACKYSPAGGQIRLRARHKGQFVEIKVSDDGAGIPRKDREYVFEAFQQLERKSGTRRGAGLGLAICKGLIEAHGGRIWVQDSRKRGTTIAFTLPVANSGEPAN